ncbi:N-methyl-L-tryptophan oxidase [Anaerolineales bacterium]
MKPYDAIVIGIGAMGSASLYHLAKRGLKVLGIEQFQIGHEKGSSHGLTRIIRLAYFEHPSYVPLLHRSYELWKILEQEKGEKFLYITGGLDAGTENSEIFQGSLRSCQEHHLAHEILNSREIQSRYPAFNLPDDMYAVYQPQAGFLLPEKGIQAHAELAQSLGATLHTGERVIHWEVNNDLVKVITDWDQVYEAAQLVICNGAWVSKLIPELQDITVPERQVLIWQETQAPELFTPQNFPIWIIEAEEGLYYGFPEFNPSGQTPGMKYGRFRHLNEIVDPDTINRVANAQDEKVLRAFAEKYLPLGAGKTLDMKVCMFTNTPNQHFILDKHPDLPQISIAAGFSGHGYKMASVIGEIMADFVQYGHSQHPVDLFKFPASKQGLEKSSS